MCVSHCFQEAVSRADNRNQCLVVGACHIRNSELLGKLSMDMKRSGDSLIDSHSAILAVLNENLLERG